MKADNTEDHVNLPDDHAWQDSTRDQKGSTFSELAVHHLCQPILLCVSPLNWVPEHLLATTHKSNEMPRTKKNRETPSFGLWAQADSRQESLLDYSELKYVPVWKWLTFAITYWISKLYKLSRYRFGITKSAREGEGKARKHREDLLPGLMWQDTIGSSLSKNISCCYLENCPR